MSEPNSKVDWFFEKPTQWKAEYKKLREIALGTQLIEELKWGCPCYTDAKRNIVLIHGFKEYCALLFFKGALMKDPGELLIQQTENVQSARQMRFTDLTTIESHAAVIEAYIREAVEIENAGLKVVLKETKEFPMPEEFRLRLESSLELKEAFENLTPGRQRGYLLHFAQPKQAATRESRIDKSVPMILAGKGLKDE